MRTHTVVIGAGQAGLAMSAALSQYDVDHVVLERGNVANAWRTARWDSLRLLTPNWMASYPGYEYAGPAPDGFMSAAEYTELLDGYAHRIAAPVESRTAVRSVRQFDDGFVVETDRGMWRSDAVVVATGAAARPAVPAFARHLTADVANVTTTLYRRPDLLSDGAVVVVGASTSGAQIASELRASGREVFLAVGRHNRVPRRYRGADIYWWLDRAGVLGDRARDVSDIEAARRQPSIMLIGSEPPRDLDLATLQRAGVRLTGRLVGIDGGTLRFADDLGDNIVDADAKLDVLLDRIDRVADRHDAPGRGERPAPVFVPRTPATLDVRAERVTSVVWATGFRPSYPWLHVPVLDGAGEIVQHEGITDVPGLYTIGLRFQRVRKSHFIGGVGADARLLAPHVASRCRVPAVA
jgi:putative flavoprotein involved in K+ transport